MAVKPRALTPPGFDLSKPGPHIRAVAPASNAREDRLGAGQAALEARGYTVSFGAHARDRYLPYFSGSAAERLADLHDAFQRPEVHVVMCTRGGYGSNYLLPGLALEQLAQTPKPFFGYSDLTTLATVLIDQLDWVVFHGPMLAADWYLEAAEPHRDDAPVDYGSFLAAISGAHIHCSARHGLRVLQGGEARGTLYGGCLSMLVSTLGTPWAPHTEGKLLFLEDVGAKPYQVDRMLRQLLLAGKLDGVPGIVFGEMLDCASPGAPPSLIEESILGALSSFRGPIGFGLRSGHVSHGNVTLPLNVAARLDLRDPAAPMLQTLEPAVQL
jgi:muramoyltetrapeptide carboxypeptidase